MATSTDGQRAHDILLGYEPLQLHGYCWYYVWEAYAAAGASTSMGSTPTAYAASKQTKGMHRGDKNPPAGAAIWLGRRSSDGNMDGDVFIAGDADGRHAATDQPTYGQTGLVSIAGRMNLTGREYIGWSDHVLDCPIKTGGSSSGGGGGGGTTTGMEPSVMMDLPWRGIQCMLRKYSAVSPGTLDGIAGPNTIRSFQTWANGRGYPSRAGLATLTVDGQYGDQTLRAEQQWLKESGRYGGAIDGLAGDGTTSGHRQAEIDNRVTCP